MKSVIIRLFVISLLSICLVSVANASPRLSIKFKKGCHSDNVDGIVGCYIDLTHGSKGKHYFIYHATSTKGDFEQVSPHYKTGNSDGKVRFIFENIPGACFKAGDSKGPKSNIICEN